MDRLMVISHATGGSSFSLPKAARQFFECRSASFLLAPALNVFPMEIIRDHVEIAGSVKPFGIDCNDRASDENRTDSGSFKVPRHISPKFSLGASRPIGWFHHLVNLT